jgi:hypothetical protein
MQWFDPDAAPPSHLLDPGAAFAGGQLHEDVGSSSQREEQIALVELLVHDQHGLPSLFRREGAGGADDAISLPPYDFDVGECVAVANRLRSGQRLYIYWRCPQREELWVSSATFLSFGGYDDGRHGTCSHKMTLYYRLEAQEDYAPRSLFPGCCGAAICTEEGWLVAMHTTGPVGCHPPYCNNRVPYWTGGVREAVPGAAGLTQLRGASRSFVDPRTYVESADLSSFDAYADGVQRGLAPNQYDAGISVFHMADSLRRWGFAFS